jgi:hypothetical protein
MLRDRSNFHIATMIFEVVEFEGSYHAILGRPCYAKFNAVPNYTYIKLKMPGPNDVITVSGSFKQPYAYGREHFELATAIANSAELQKLRRTVEEGAPNCNELSPSSAFCPTEDTKAVGVDPTARPRPCRSGPNFQTNGKARSSTSNAPIVMPLHGSLPTC